MADFINILLRCVIMVPFVIVLTRLAGLRSFSKMSSFDFVITLATGSILASTVMSPSTPLLHGVAALVGLFVVQIGIARLRTGTTQVADLIDNAPLLIMRDGQFLMDNIRKANMTKADVIGKLREANALDLSKVRAVIFEQTGDVSVLHGDKLDQTLLQGVQSKA
ncbi:YetF domain-containing protein [Loktanella sp. SALINAS62]|uniref:DUF421 domain-containing protein n=1 Tax=Loktanella sp. SALINAS62 TaxID=2706124 RepID=UPI001B8D1103|nr:YetF domain-containing protein [Loktanella sp. SALINAS62]MBS1302202.1 DUF421 domain-containing protein [Loktanella sp. SALINAS62]